MASGYQRLRWWSITEGGWVERLSVPDANGAEHWMQITDHAGADEDYRHLSTAERRLQRLAAVEAIQRHIDLGGPPGEVVLLAHEWAGLLAEMKMGA